MKFLILGATGPVGILVTKQLVFQLESWKKSSPEQPRDNPGPELSQSQDHTQKLQGHKIILFARSPQKLPPDVTDHPLIQVVNAQLTDLDKLEEVMEGVGTVISALGPSAKRGPFHPSGEPLAKAYHGIVKVMQKRGVRRILLLGTAYMTAPEDKSDARFTALITGVDTFARNAYKDGVAIAKIITSLGEQDGVYWTIVRVPLLTYKDNR
ncbi:hypothetical protein MPER_03425, partial [Moniliophthora perniciosa FA553]